MVVNFEKMIKHMTYHIIPHRAVMYQQRYMLGGLRKPENMTTRKFCNHLTELNTYLALFPNDRFFEEGVLSGFSEDQKIPEHLLVTIIYFSLPKTWLTTITTHGFDYVERNDPKGDLIKYCEKRIKVLKHEEPAAKKRLELKLAEQPRPHSRALLLPATRAIQKVLRALSASLM
jgi:hypothetical protein